MSVEAIRRREVVAQEVGDLARRAFEKARFDPYGLDPRWTGLRFYGGHGESDGLVTRLTIGHRDGLGDPPTREIRVETIVGESDLARRLSQSFWNETGVLSDDVRRAVFPRTGGNVDPFESWETIELPVDAATVQFRALSHNDFWVAGRVTDLAAIAVRSRGWPADQTGLVTINDLKPYLEGAVENARRPRHRDHT